MSDENNRTKVVKSFSSHFTNSEGKRIFCKYWTPSHVAARIFISHGYGEHCLCYTEIAMKLATRGFFVFAHDHAGHGQSEGERVQTNSFGNYVRDIFQHIDSLDTIISTKLQYKKNSPPFFFLGHSMGGLICILATLKRPDLADGLVLCSPAMAMCSDVASPLKITIAQAIGQLLPNFPLGSFQSERSCSSAESIKIMEEDVLRWHGPAKAQFCSSMIEAQQEIQNNLGNFKTPFLILQGEADRVCNPDSAKYFYENAPATDKSIILYANAFHNLLMEPKKISEKVEEDILDWLTVRI